MRLVIEHVVSDGYTYSFTSTYPFEYESAEKLLIDIETMVNAEIAYAAKEREAWDAFNRTYDYADIRTNAGAERWLSLRNKVLETYPYRSPEEKAKLVAGNVTLRANDFIEDGKFEAPEIYTVEEWFVRNGM